MSRRTRRLLLIALPAVAVVVAAWLRWPRTAITRENAAKVKEGMTRAEVEAILGGPARNETTERDGWFVTLMRSWVVVWNDRTPASAFSRSWTGHACAILVAFDGDGRVVQVRLTNVLATGGGPLDRLRRWLGL
jgi:outer membrane protein assembly factor BamE (lipoprotein component of BamABCDE complex)